MTRRSPARLTQLFEEIAPARERLLKHRMYGLIDSRERLSQFMQIHVYAVWDFMSLAKRLQREATCVELPWFPPRHPAQARFINEVVLGEESDFDAAGNPCSHLELYLEAMSEVGAETESFLSFLDGLRGGEKLATALTRVEAGNEVRAFVLETIGRAVGGHPVEVAAFFFFGREDIIPEMFQRLIDQWDGWAEEIPKFTYYLARHIELDGDHHGPLAQRLLVSLAGDDGEQWARATRAAEHAINLRVALWDAVCEAIQI